MRVLPIANAETMDKVYTEMISLRQNNRVLEMRVKTLEKQNVEISKSLDYVGNNEPTRPVMMEAAEVVKPRKRKAVRYSEEQSMQFSPSEEDFNDSP